MAAACARLGRPYAAEAAAALQNNWYATAGEFVALSDETTRSLGVPLRLKATVAELLAAGDDGGTQQQQQQQQPSSGLAGSLFGSAVQLPNAAARLLGWMGGSSSAPPGAAPAAEPGAVRGAAAAAQQADESLGSESDSDGADADELAAAVAGSVQRFAAAAGEDADQLALPIEERRCPLQRRAGNADCYAVRVSKRSRAERYALSVSRGVGSGMWPRAVVPDCPLSPRSAWAARPAGSQTEHPASHGPASVRCSFVPRRRR